MILNTQKTLKKEINKFIGYNNGYSLLHMERIQVETAQSNVRQVQQQTTGYTKK